MHWTRYSMTIGCLRTFDHAPDAPHRSRPRADPALAQRPSRFSGGPTRGNLRLAQSWWRRSEAECQVTVAKPSHQSSGSAFSGRHRAYQGSQTGMAGLSNETVKVFGAMPIWRPAVGWLSLRNPAFKRLRCCRCWVSFLNPAYEGFLHSLKARAGTGGISLNKLKPRRYGQSVSDGVSPCYRVEQAAANDWSTRGYESTG
jgi:hypothetical protein